MSYVVEIVFRAGNVPPSRLFGVFPSTERAQVFALDILIKVDAAMDYKVRPLERVEG